MIYELHVRAFADSDEDERYDLIATAVKSSSARAAYSDQSRAFFKEYFDVNGVAEQYDRFYETVPQRRSMSIMSLLWGAYVYYRSCRD